MKLTDLTTEKDKRDLRRFAARKPNETKAGQIKKQRKKTSAQTLGEAFPDRLPPEAQRLTLPPLYAVQNGELWTAGDETNLLTTTPILPLRCFEDIDTETTSIEIAIISENSVKVITMEAKTLADQRQILSLANQGLDVASPNASALVKFIQAYKRANHLPMIHQTARLGFRPIGEERVYLLDKSYPAAKRLIFRAENESDRARQAAMAPHGTPERWHALWPIILRFPKVTLVILANLAPTVRELLELEAPSFILHECSTSSSGKTVAQRIGLSVWANPEAEQWRIHGHATFAGIETLCLQTYGLPVIIEDTHLMSDKDRTALIYAAGNEHFKARGGKQTRTQWPWHGAIIASAESALLSEESAQGEAARVIELNGSPFGNVSPDIRDLIDNEIQPIIRQNWGHLGHQLIELLLGLSQEQVRELQRLHAKLREQWATKAEAFPLLARQSPQWALLDLTAIVLAKLIGQEQAEQARRAVAACFEECRRQPQPDLTRRAHEILVGMIRANEAYCYTDGDMGIREPARQGTVIGVINRKEGWVGCYRGFAETELRKHGYTSPSRVWTTLKEKGLLRADAEHNTWPVRISGEQRRMVCLWLKEDHIEEPADT